MKKKLIEAKNLYLGYETQDIIKDANFSIYTEDFVFLTGRSGSGKTTLIKSFYGEIKPKKGRLNIGEYTMHKINKYSLQQLRRYLGIVFQDFKLIPEWTILKNVMLPLLIKGEKQERAKEEAIELLKKVKLSNKIDKFPKELSGGEQQRAAIARAIIHKPVIIFADEPISGLDEYSANLVMDIFKMANKELGITIFIASHSLPKDPEIKFRHFHLDEKGFLNELS